MTFDSIITIAAFCCYLIFMLCIGMYFVGKNRTTNEYFLGGRQLGSWVTSMSAQASDMSGWLLMGLPGAAYLSGIPAGWIAIGLAIGTYLNCLLVAKQRCLFWCFSCFTLRPALYPARSCSRPYSAFRTWCRCWSVQ